MAIELTEQQQRSRDERGADLPRVTEPRTQATYVLDPASNYDVIREVLEDDRQQRAIRVVSQRNAIGRMGR